jgi:serine/threonine protein kinase
MSELTCLKCQAELAYDVDACPECGDKITQFQRTYAGRLIDGKYQILERLGVGGMGEIFKVRHIHLGEQRVIKIMRANIASDDDALQRFLHEAKLATTVKHRNLAMLYDFSTLDDGSYYMVWEFIDGVNIQKWIAKNGPVPPRLAVEIAIQALSGLEALHQMGIIHRDISPENIMLSQDYRGNLLGKVIDFGIAKQLSEGEGGQGLTATGMFLGKLKYASPEQAGFIKEGEHLDARSDLYSFGIVVYEMLAGRAPFLATNPHGYILKHATEKPPTFAEVNPGVSVPAKLEAIVFKALEKDRSRRHASTADFIAELESIRKEIPPDQKYGLGERMITLSSTPTVLDATLGRKQRTGTAATRPAPTVQGKARPSGRTAAEEATVVERADTLSGQATVVEKSRGADATVIESVAGAAPTVVEPKVAQWQPQGAAPTVLERKFAQAKKKPALLVGYAAAALMVVGTAIYIGVKPDPDPVASTTGDQATTTATSTGTPATGTTEVTAASMTGVLRVIGGPADRITRIEDLSRNKAVELSSTEDFSLPFRAQLPAGQYRVTITGGDGSPEAQTVFLEPGKEAKVLKSRRRLDIDKVVDDVLRP